MRVTHSVATRGRGVEVKMRWHINIYGYDEKGFDVEYSGYDHDRNEYREYHFTVDSLADIRPTPAEMKK